MTHPIYDFTGQVVLVTGGGSGIGLATAQAFAASGAAVAIAGRTAERLEAAAKSLRDETGARIECFTADVTDGAQCAALVADVVARLGRIDVLVNNAGGGRHAPLRKFRTDKWRAEFDLNVHSAFYCAQAAADHMIERGSGSIVNISSLAGLHGTMGVAAYSAAKAGLQMFTRVAAAEWGPRGVRVNCVAAGMIATELAQANWAKTGFDAAGSSQAFPLRRPGRPYEVAQAVLFFASDAASYITGEVLAVAGGPQLKGMIDV